MASTERKQPRRKSQAAQNVGLSPELIEKRTKRHLEELERTNYTEPTVSIAGVSYGEGGARARARETISDKRVWPGKNRNRKKALPKAVRDALVYRKNFATLLEESGIQDLPPDVPTYLTAVAPPPVEPPRQICTVCGYWGNYKCMRCSMAYCDMNCRDTHNETRCERRLY